MAKETYSVTAALRCTCCPCCGHDESCENGKIFSSCSGVTSLGAATEIGNRYAKDLKEIGDEEEVWIIVESVGPRGGRKIIWDQAVWKLNATG